MRQHNRDNWNNAENTQLPELHYNTQWRDEWQRAGALTKAVVVVCVLVFVLQWLTPMVYDALHYYPRWDVALVMAEPWRLITPAFMHGGFVHIGFNLVLWWLLAQNIERVKGGSELLLIICIGALVSNYSQFVMTGPAFLGLSGIVFALGGYSLSHAYFAKLPALAMTQPVMLMLVLSLLIGFVFGDVLNVGNASHLSGLLTGLILGWVKSLG